MAFSKVTNADLVIYTNKGILIVEVLFDKYLWEEMLVKLNKFYSKHMIPEILTRRIKKLLSCILYKINTSTLVNCGHCWKFYQISDRYYNCSYDNML